jgi:hypothetical protein
MREAQEDAVWCTNNQRRPSSSGSQSNRVLFINSLGPTATEEARRDGSDSLHYGANTTQVEAQLLLNVMCPDVGNGGRVLDATPAEPARGAAACDTAAPRRDSDMKATTGEGAGKCIPEGWKPRHNL